MTGSSFNRRKFLGAAASVAAAGVVRAPASADGGSALERIRVGLVGLRHQGRALLKELLLRPDVEVLTLCDVDPRMLTDSRGLLQEAGRTLPSVEGDYRRLLEDSRLDALVLATPDHWHVPMTVQACQAGKDVYVEAPLGHTVCEGLEVIEAAAIHGRIVQTGLQQRSGEHFQSAIEAVRAGEIGKVRMVKAWASLARGYAPPVDNSRGIQEVDYQTWLGPAGHREFHPLRFHQTWPWFWDYGAGELGLWGVHLLDVALWGMQAGWPTRISATGGQYQQPTELETPDTLLVHYTFDDFVLTWEHRQWTRAGQEGRTAAVAFHGDAGTLIVDRGGWKIYGTRHGRAAPASDLLGPHLDDFFEAMRTRQTPSAPPVVGHQSSAIAHLGNVSYRVNRELLFDPVHATCIGDNLATELLHNPRAMVRCPGTVEHEVSRSHG